MIEPNLNVSLPKPDTLDENKIKFFKHWGIPGFHVAINSKQYHENTCQGNARKLLTIYTNEVECVGTKTS